MKFEGSLFQRSLKGKVGGNEDVVDYVESSDRQIVMCIRGDVQGLMLMELCIMSSSEGWKSLGFLVPWQMGIILTLLLMQIIKKIGKIFQ